MGPLDGKLVVVAPGAGESNFGRYAASGAIVLVVGSDSEAVGAAVARLRISGARAAGFVGDPSKTACRAALAEMAKELFSSYELAAGDSRLAEALEIAAIPPSWE